MATYYADSRTAPYFHTKVMQRDRDRDRDRDKTDTDTKQTQG